MLTKERIIEKKGEMEKEKAITLIQAEYNEPLLCIRSSTATLFTPKLLRFSLAEIVRLKNDSSTTSQ